MHCAVFPYGNPGGEGARIFNVRSSLSHIGLFVSNIHFKEIYDKKKGLTKMHARIHTQYIFSQIKKTNGRNFCLGIFTFYTKNKRQMK